MARLNVKKLGTVDLFKEIDRADVANRSALTSEITRRARDEGDETARRLCLEKWSLRFVTPAPGEKTMLEEKQGAAVAEPEPEAPQVPDESGGEEYLPLTRIAVALGTSRSMLWKACIRNELPHILGKGGGSLPLKLVRLSEARAWLAEHIAKNPHRNKPRRRFQPAAPPELPPSVPPQAEGRESETSGSTGKAENSRPRTVKEDRAERRARLLARHAELGLALRELPGLHHLEAREYVLREELAAVQAQMINVMEVTVEFKRVELALLIAGQGGRET